MHDTQPPPQPSDSPPAGAPDALARAADISPDLVCTLTADGVVDYVNAAGLRLLGARDLADVRGRAVESFVATADRELLERARCALRDGAGVWCGELHVLSADGSAPLHVATRAAVVRDASDGIAAIAVVMHDLAERDRLAGGVVHDFNDLLTVILNTVDLVRGDLPRAHPLQVDLDVARGAAMRAGVLTRELLALQAHDSLDARRRGVRALVGDAPPPDVPTRGRETVLLVEDEAAVRGIARRILERAGYTVLEARHGADALLVWRDQGGARGAIDVLLTDVRMPELGGRELAEALRRERPGLPVVFVSGYLHEAAERERFVAKPFVAPELQRAVRMALDGSRAA